MSEPVKPSRTHDYPRRRERARATHVRILDAARTLFIERGYVSTTIDAIAERADVAPETVYSTFGTKRSLLSELIDVSIAGDTPGVPILEQDWVQDMREEPDPQRRIRMLASQGRSILERRAAIDNVVRGAASADPEIAALRDQGMAQRFAGQREILRLVVGSAGLRAGIDLEAAADIHTAISGPAVTFWSSTVAGADPDSSDGMATRSSCCSSTSAVETPAFDEIPAEPGWGTRARARAPYRGLVDSADGQPSGRPGARRPCPRLGRGRYHGPRGRPSSTVRADLADGRRSPSAALTETALVPPPSDRTIAAHLEAAGLPCPRRPWSRARRHRARRQDRRGDWRGVLGDPSGTCPTWAASRRLRSADWAPGSY
jgi:AcrR family transcriptional regulator